jgi:hypothetical protein
VVLIIGIIMQAATGSKVALCNSFAGQIGQAFDQQASAGCSVANGVHTFGQVLVWVSVAGFLGVAYRLWPVLPLHPRGQGALRPAGPAGEGAGGLITRRARSWPGRARRKGTRP